MTGPGSVVRFEAVPRWGREPDATTQRIGIKLPHSETRDRVRAGLSHRVRHTFFCERLAG